MNGAALLARCSIRGLSQNIDSHRVCEAIRADALVKHIVDQECHYMGKCSLTCFQPDQWVNRLGEASLPNAPL